MRCVLFSSDALVFLILASYLIYQNVKLQELFKSLSRYIKIHVSVLKTCDEAKIKFNNLLDNEIKKHIINFSGFKVENKCLDRFTSKKAELNSCEAWFCYE